MQKLTKIGPNEATQVPREKALRTRQEMVQVEALSTAVTIQAERVLRSTDSSSRGY